MSINNKRKTMSGRQHWRTKYNLLYLEVSSLPLFRLITGYDYLQWHLNRTGIKGSPMCPLYGDAA